MDYYAVSQALIDRLRSKGYSPIYGNNGAGLIIFIYPEAPAWAVDQIKSDGAGGVKGAVVDLYSNYRWAPSHLAWDNEVSASWQAPAFSP